MIRSNRDSHANELGPDSAGQSGDLQQVSNTAEADSESVEELAGEGNAFEADAIAGVEEAGNDSSEVRIRQVPVDGVLADYLNDEDEHMA